MSPTAVSSELLERAGQVNGHSSTDPVEPEPYDETNPNADLERLDLEDLYNSYADTQADRAGEYKRRNGGQPMDRNTIPGAHPGTGYLPAWMPIREEILFKRIAKKVVCIGAGFSGLR